MLWMIWALSLQKFFIRTLSYHITASIIETDQLAYVIPEGHGEGTPRGNIDEPSVGDPFSSSPVSVVQLPT
jgi:hypothetical protein